MARRVPGGMTGTVLNTHLRDEDIRWKLHGWLMALHAADGDTGIIHELPLPRPSARADMAVVNGEFVGLEIKSDVDSLQRLPRQIAAFSSVFDRVCLVTTDHHLTDARRVVPAWWGIVYLRREELDFYRLPDFNPHVRADSLLWLLRKTDLIALLRSAMPETTWRGTFCELARAALDLVELDTIRGAVRMALKRECERVAPTFASIPPNHRQSPRYWLPRSGFAGEGGC